MAEPLQEFTHDEYDMMLMTKLELGSRPGYTCGVISVLQCALHE